MTLPFTSRQRFLVGLLLLGWITDSALAQSALCVERNGKTYVVQKVARGFAFIKEGDKLVSVKATRSGLVPVSEFYPLFVSVRNLEVKTSYVEFMQGGGDINNEFHFTATFESPYYLENPFLVLELDMEMGGKRVFFQEIGELRPGKPQWIRVGIPLQEKLGPGQFKMHIFTEGREVFHSEQPWEFREGALNQMVTKRIEGVKDAPPQAFVGPAPEYPAALRKSRVNGEAVVAIRITRLGVVADPELVKATNPAFGEAALVAVRQWRFLPQVKNGRAIETRANMPFSFEAPAEDAKP